MFCKYCRRIIKLLTSVTSLTLLILGRWLRFIRPLLPEASLLAILRLLVAVALLLRAISISPYLIPLAFLIRLIMVASHSLIFLEKGALVIQRGRFIQVGLPGAALDLSPGLSGLRVVAPPPVIFLPLLRELLLIEVAQLARALLLVYVLSILVGLARLEYVRVTVVLVSVTVLPAPAPIITPIVRPPSIVPAPTSPLIAPTLVSLVGLIPTPLCISVARAMCLIPRVLRLGRPFKVPALAQVRSILHLPVVDLLRVTRKAGVILVLVASEGLHDEVLRRHFAIFDVRLLARGGVHLTTGGCLLLFRRLRLALLRLLK